MGFFQVRESGEKVRHWRKREPEDNGRRDTRREGKGARTETVSVEWGRVE